MTKLLLNNKLLFLKFPLSGILFYFGRKDFLQKHLLKLAFRWTNFEGQKMKDFQIYWKEIRSNDFTPLQNANEKQTGNALHSTFGKWIYICIRAKKPDIIIETGVSHGYSSWVILNAIQKNQKGHLYSIDLAGNDTNSDYNLTQEKIGQVVAESLKKDWTLIIGDVKEKLPELLEKLPEIDLFFHDSDHSYQHMKFEFDIAFQHLDKNGIILSDDIHKNKAFEEFTMKNQLKNCVFTKGGMCFK